ncbi:MAG: endolytic transglycosylase MltG [Candidatus Vogelbacteria bacterium]|nr:endolytic transglycosylase MltG [Candidatus Vogelbacteria bacterium]
MGNFTPYKKKCLGILGACLVLFFSIYLAFISPPKDFPTGRYITIEKGLTIAEAGEFMKDKKLIRSDLFFRPLIYLFGKTDKVIAGEYKFSEPMNLYSLVKIVTDTEFKGRSVRLTVPEGLTSKEMGALIGDKFLGFSGDDFWVKAKGREGYLFPDTYILPVTYTIDNIITRMTDNFTAKIAPLREKIIKSKYTLKQVVIMASIVEREARTLETRKKIAGILWKRLDAGMALQVDAPFGFLLNKGTSEITSADLKIDSPYNTYRYKGLPPGPISNPSFSAIQATVDFTPSAYLFYLSDPNGIMHYAVTYAEHLKNKAQYLK